MTQDSSELPTFSALSLQSNCKMSTIKSMLSVLLSIITLVFGFSTSAKSDQLNFIVLGDWGGLNFFPYKTPVESAVAKQMSKTSEQLGAQFIVALGKLT